MTKPVCLLLFVVCRWVTAHQQNVIHMSQQWNEKDNFDHNTELNKAATTAQQHVQKAFSFASYYGDHMVLQKAPQQATIWGYHPDSGARVIVQVTGRKAHNAVVDELGAWRVLLDAESSPGPFSITAMIETQTIHLNDVLFGDVWLCSGQSNMAFTLDMALNGSEEIKEAKNFQDIRVFTVKRQRSTQPLSDLVAVLEKWSLPSNDSLGLNWQYFSAICWLYGKYMYQKLGYPIGLIDTTYGGTPIEQWMSADALKKCGDTPQHKHSETAVIERLKAKTISEPDQKPVLSERAPQYYGELWNAMVNPFLPMTIYGVIWDQGENDAYPLSICDNYNCTFPTMIADWQSKFSEASHGQTRADFPFGFVQIGPWYEGSTMNRGYPDIRWHQTADYGYVPNPKMTNVFMAVSMDISDFGGPHGDVHTRDKQDIARRLFLGGLDVAYNISSLWRGPLPVNITQFSDTLVLNYGTTWTLELKQTEGFELCCSLDGGHSCQPSEGKAWWVPTPITASNATHVELYADVCRVGQNILGLRYAWRLSPCQLKQCPIYSKQNALPAPPFVVYPRVSSSENGSTFALDWSKPVHIW